jgi:hypothetical protein
LRSYVGSDERTESSGHTLVKQRPPPPASSN